MLKQREGTSGPYNVLPSPTAAIKLFASGLYTSGQYEVSELKLTARVLQKCLKHTGYSNLKLT
jgi:hypothetical protein